MRVFSTLMLTLMGADALAATGTLADLENTVPHTPLLQASARLSAAEEARINAQLYERMMKMARSSRDPAVINAYLELARKIKTGVSTNADETVELQNRVSFYEELLRTLPASEIRDDFYYELASSNDKLGNVDRAVDLLDEMIKRFPDTRFASESHFRIAENLFSRNKFNDALREYNLVLNNGNDRYWQQAQYQLAWAYYKDGRYDDAIAPFERLIDSLQAKYQLSKGEQLRLDDSYSTLSRVFVQLGGAPALAAHYAKQSLSPDEIRIYKAVSDRYREQQQPFDVAQTYENFIQRHPLAAETAEFNRELIRVYKEAGFAKDIIRVKNDYIQRFDTQSAYFQQATPALQATLRPELKANLDDLAKHYHASAQNNKSPAEYLKAADLYRKQLALATEPADQIRINELMADALYSGGQFETAIAVFEQLAYDKTNIGTKPADAGYFALLAYQARMKQLPAEQQLAWLEQQKNSSLRFAQTFSSDKNAAPILLTIISQYLDRKDFTTVSDLSMQLLKLPSLSAADRKTTSILLANARFDQQQWAEAENAYRQVLALGDLSRDDTIRYQNQLAATLYRQADMAQATDPANASRLYQQASDTTQDTKVKVDAAWHAAMVIGETAAAVPQLQAFYTRYFSTEQAIGIPERIVAIQEKLQDWQGASRTYQQIYQRDTRNKPDNALAAFWLAAESERKAVVGGTTEPRTSPASVAELALYRQYLIEPRANLTQSVEASERLYQDARLRRDMATQKQEMNRQLEWAAKLNNAPASLQPRLRYLAARAHTLIDQPLIDQYRAIVIGQPLKDSISRKQASLQKLLASQQAILDLKVAEFVTPAQYVLGDSFARFYQGVNAAPVPTGMSELEAEQYQITIEEQTQPLKDKAIEWHKANAALATLTDGALWDQWIAKSFEALAGLSAGYYQRELHRPAIPTTDSALLAGFAQLDSGQLDAALVSADALISSRSIVTPPPTPVQTVSTKKSKNRKTVPIVAAPIIAPDPSPLAQARLLRALSLMKLGRFNDADATLTQASADMPDWAELPYTQGINRELYLKQAQGALDAYTRYLALSGTDKTVQKWVNLLQKQLSLPLTSFAKPTPVVAPATTDTPTAEPTAPAISEAAPPIIPAASTPDATRTETPQ